MRIAAVAALALVCATSGLAATTVDFTNGAAVAGAMERHYNSAVYKNRIAKSAGARLSGRVLCAHDDLLERVECTGRLLLQGKQIRAKWELEKRTARRAQLSWTYKGPGVFEFDDEIVTPSAFGLSRF